MQYSSESDYSSDMSSAPYLTQDEIASLSFDGVDYLGNGYPPLPTTAPGNLDQLSTYNSVHHGYSSSTGAGMPHNDGMDQLTIDSLLLAGGDAPSWGPIPTTDAATAAQETTPPPPSMPYDGSGGYDPSVYGPYTFPSGWQLPPASALTSSPDALPPAGPFPDVDLWSGYGLYPQGLSAYDVPMGPLASGDLNMPGQMLGLAGPSQPPSMPPATPYPTYGLYMPQGGVVDAVGRYVQPNNTLTPPAQPQGSLGDTNVPSSSSSTTGSTTAADVADAQPVPANGNEQDEKKAKKVPWAKSLVGQMCKAREITEESPLPLACFFCEAAPRDPVTKAILGQHGGGKCAKLYYTWRSFVGHMRRCRFAPKEKPICHFCGKVRNAGRPAQMARHMDGSYDNRPCDGLQAVMRSGVMTYGALADWLQAKQLPITNPFLGKKYADPLRAAARTQKNPVGRDVLLGIPLLPPPKETANDTLLPPKETAKDKSPANPTTKAAKSKGPGKKAAKPKVKKAAKSNDKTAAAQPKDQTAAQPNSKKRKRGGY